ncbi:MAG: 5-(carboxyamino)imidazole ribonucleotide synthase [Acidobacteriaceae bacterium]|jgi:5-(carboxyamino)imidazole ribonucleotide synthase|nr:5-(carboxyamino)imidazole ribonucleotide synthase [Acidobacteriaceae bacterium]
MTPPAVLPGATVGVLGGGQLGRMFAMAARRMGYRVHCLAPEYDTPTGQIADLEVVAPYDDLDRICEFARGVDVVTFEFENVSADAVAAAEAHALVRPNGRSLHIAQHRVREKTFLRDCGLPVAPFAAVSRNDDLESAVRRIGRPSVLKTAAFGYDGKGQVMITADTDPQQAWTDLGGHESVLEAFIDLDREISMVAARGVDGHVELFAPFENVHRHHILDVTTAPAGISERMAREAAEIARVVVERLDYVGVLCVEFFVASDGRLLINEIAPRPHNSGHLTFDACRTSQFEQQVRAICGLSLGSPELLQPAAMANLLGDLWANGEPDWLAVSAFTDVKVHLYGKMSARPGRKMGHLTALAPSTAEARARVLAAREALVR